MQEVWQEVLKRVRRQVRSVEFRNWFKPLQVAGWHNGSVVLQVKDGDFQAWFAQHHEPILRAALEEVVLKPVDIEYSITDPELFDHVRVEQPPVQFPEGFTFDEFVVGPSNHMAYAAGRAAADRPGRAYNPLFIYGETGLGKTHLLYAIGHGVRTMHPRLRVLYITSETYMNDMHAFLRLKSMEQFRAKYRDACDVLLVDDVQFFSRGRETQTQFFHTFNALHAARKQIVFTSDRPPLEIPGIEGRLRSRFEWGLIADINPPELETRVAILKTKAEAMQMDLPDEVANYVAQHVRDNVRELESCLKILHLAIMTGGGPVGLKMAQEKLRVYLKNQARMVSVDQVRKAVSARFGMTVEELTSDCRRRNLATPRHIAMYLSRKLAGASYPEIGKEFGGRDHASVMSACRKIEKLVRIDTAIQQVVEELEQRLKR